MQSYEHRVPRRRLHLHHQMHVGREHADDIKILVVKIYHQDVNMRARYRPPRQGELSCDWAGACKNHALAHTHAPPKPPFPGQPGPLDDSGVGQSAW
jgi:hypothetical protein